jgi:hypothetical protein
MSRRLEEKGMFGVSVKSRVVKEGRARRGLLEVETVEGRKRRERRDFRLMG